ncbi:hypothetical protein L596_012822 [Steinernema carpocapsae]|uniref:Uncharacterized protein n=1 Tax=Steinernema carpocapsae TaxID=34508 RepID=A0A4U5NYW1_STECR|nr:hypothetical protein L596_012822 [Steinernema carpocapsae]
MPNSENDLKDKRAFAPSGHRTRDLRTGSPDRYRLHKPVMSAKRSNVVLRVMISNGHNFALFALGQLIL